MSLLIELDSDNPAVLRRLSIVIRADGSVVAVIEGGMGRNFCMKQGALYGPRRTRFSFPGG